MSSQRGPFHDGGLKPASGGVDARRKSRRAAAHDENVQSHRFRVFVGYEDALRLQLVQGRREQLLGLRPHADHHVVGVCLGHAVGLVLLGQFGAALDVDQFEMDHFGVFDGGLDRVYRLLGAVGARRAHENLDVARGVDLADHLGRLFVHAAASHADQNQGFHECTPFLSPTGAPIQRIL